jgi:hypothetical protein
MQKARTVTFKIPEALLAAALSAARGAEMTGGEFIRAAVAERVADLAGGDGDPVAVLRRALRRHFAEAGDWPDLQRRLRSEKFVLREVDGELWLHTWPVERRLVPLARMGVTREDLTLAYRTPFPYFGARVLVFAKRVLKVA